MNWYKKAEKYKDPYVYHGTSEGAFRQIREYGLIPQGNNQYIYFSDIPQYAKTYAERKGNSYGNRILRIKRRADIIPDSNSNYNGDFKTNIPVSPEEIDILINNEWISIVQYIDDNIGIMPINKEQHRELV